MTAPAWVVVKSTALARVCCAVRNDAVCGQDALMVWNRKGKPGIGLCDKCAHQFQRGLLTRVMDEGNVVKKLDPATKLAQVREILRGAMTQAKGVRSEYKILRIIAGLELSFAENVRLATAEEDRQGIDIVVETDFGDLYIQVKSSKEKARQWLRRARKGRLPHDTTWICVVSASREPKRLGEELEGCLTAMWLERARAEEEPSLDNATSDSYVFES